MCFFVHTYIHQVFTKSSVLCIFCVCLFSCLCVSLILFFTFFVLVVHYLSCFCCLSRSQESAKKSSPGGLGASSWRWKIGFNSTTKSNTVYTIWSIAWWSSICILYFVSSMKSIFHGLGNFQCVVYVQLKRTDLISWGSQFFYVQFIFKLVESSNGWH